MVSSFLHFDNVHCNNTPAPPSTPHLRSWGCYDPLITSWISDPTATNYNVILTGSINTVISIPSFGKKENTLSFFGLLTDITISLVAINCAGSSSPLVIFNSTIGIGVSVGVLVLLVLILVIVGVVYCFSKGRRKSG
ncbi:hypothetical protein EMCRGX_G028222 [Ephydatia muelleri]